MGREAANNQRQKNGVKSLLDRLCLVCPLPDCFHKSSGCLHRQENRPRGEERLSSPEQREKRFGYE